jgi:hypothetical protein
MLVESLRDAVSLDKFLLKPLPIALRRFPHHAFALVFQRRKRLRKSQLQKIAALNALPRPEYLSHASAVQAAKVAINSVT